MPTEPLVLNWYGENEQLTEGLNEKLTDKKDSFITIRLGNKYANLLNPGDEVAISVSDNPENPNIVGFAKVGVIKKAILIDLQIQEESLEKNIGAKNWDQVLHDMRSVYGHNRVSEFSTITVIELFPL